METDKVLGKRLHTETKDDKLTTNFKKFHKGRRDKVYKQLNEAEKSRFDAHNEVFGSKIVSVIEKLIQDLPGQTSKTVLKMEKQVSRLITSAAKIHGGQLIELAK